MIFDSQKVGLAWWALIEFIAFWNMKEYVLFTLSLGTISSSAFELYEHVWGYKVNLPKIFPQDNNLRAILTNNQYLQSCIRTLTRRLVCGWLFTVFKTSIILYNSWAFTIRMIMLGVMHRVFLCYSDWIEILHASISQLIEV